MDEIRGRHRPEAVEDSQCAALPLPEPRPLRWRVSLPWAGEAEVVAPDEAAAVAEFNRRCGVVESAHKHSVTLLGD